MITSPCELDLDHHKTSLLVSSNANPKSPGLISMSSSSGLFSVSVCGIFQRWPQDVPPSCSLYSGTLTLLQSKGGVGAPPFKPHGPLCDFWGYILKINALLFCFLDASSWNRATKLWESPNWPTWRDHMKRPCKVSGQQEAPNKWRCLYNPGPSCGVTPSLQVIPSPHVFPAEAPDISEQRPAKYCPLSRFLMLNVIKWLLYVAKSWSREQQ